MAGRFQMQFGCFHITKAEGGLTKVI